MKITKGQHEYMLMLKDGPMTTLEIVRDRMVCKKSVLNMLSTLRGRGLVESKYEPGQHGNSKSHRLSIPYHRLSADGLEIGTVKKRMISDEEVLYVAILRNGGMLGSRLRAQYNTRYPTRSEASVKNVVAKAVKRGLCR